MCLALQGSALQRRASPAQPTGAACQSGRHRDHPLTASRAAGDPPIFTTAAALSGPSQPFLAPQSSEHSDVTIDPSTTPLRQLTPFRQLCRTWGRRRTLTRKRRRSRPLIEEPRPHVASVISCLDLQPYPSALALDNSEASSPIDRSPTSVEPHRILSPPKPTACRIDSDTPMYLIQ